MRNEVQKLPALFLERLKKIIPPQKWDEMVNTFTEPRPTTFRINTLKISPSPLTLSPQGGERSLPAARPRLPPPQGLAGPPGSVAEDGGQVPARQGEAGVRGQKPESNLSNSVQEQLQHLGFRLEKVPWYPDAFILRGGRLRDLQETEAYQKGEIYVQSLSSMIPPLVLDPQPGESVLDLTAAPGSKTTQLACLMKGEGRIVANDNNPIRFFKLKANVELQTRAGFPRQGAETAPLRVQLTMRPGELFGRDFPEQFDKVLLDAPCSAEGRFLVTESATYKYWKLAKVKEMVRKQKNLILSAFRALKPGGTLVYSTCTFAPEENEGVADWLLEKCRGGVSPPSGRGDLASTIEKITLPISNQMSGLIRWETEGRGVLQYAPAVRNTIRILPTPLMEAFYVARIRKI